MPTYDFKCQADVCGAVVERQLRISERHEPGPCPDCGGVLERIYLTQRQSAAQRFEPIVYHEDASGNLRFPAHGDAPLPSGFIKKELRTLSEADAFRRRVSRIEDGKIAERIEREHARIEHIESVNRPDLRQAMQRMSPASRAFAELAIRINNARRPRTFESGFHLDIIENDQGTRERYCDERTGWRGRRA